MSSTKPELRSRFSVGSRQFRLEIFFLVAGVLLAFVIRWHFLPLDSVINGDGAYYTTLGERFVSGDLAGGLSAYWSPLYSVLTGLFSLLFTERDFAGRFVSLVAGALLIVPSYFLIREFFGRPAAVVGSIFIIVDPFLIRSSGWVMTESVYSLILTTCVLVGWYALSKVDWGLFLTTGLLLGAAFLTKPEAIGYVVLMLVLTPVALLLKGKRNLLQTAQYCVILLLGFGILFLPYFVYLHQKTGNWTVSQKIAVNLPAADYDGEFLGLMRGGKTTMKDILWGDDYESSRSTESPAREASPNTSFDLRQVASALKILGSKALVQLYRQARNYLPAILPIPFAIFAAAGFLLGGWNKMRVAKEAYLLCFVGSTLLGYAASSIELRYLFPIIPLLTAWTADGVVRTSEWLMNVAGSRFSKRPIAAYAFSGIIVLVLLFGWGIPRCFSTLKKDDISNVPFEEKKAGLWIKEHANGSQPTVMSANITPAFYAHAKHLYLPDESFSEVANYARTRLTNYLVFSTRRMMDTKSLDNAGLQRDMNLVYQDSENPDYEVFIYQVNY